MTSWVVQIFALSDARAEELISGLLAGIADIVVESAHSGSDRFIVIESADPVQAQSVLRIVTSIDFRARLVHTSSAPAEPDRVGGRVPARMAYSVSG